MFDNNIWYLLIIIVIGAVVYFKAFLPSKTAIDNNKEEKKETDKTSTGKIFFFSLLSVISSFLIGGVASYFIDKHFAEYFLPFLVNSILIFMVIALVLTICGVAISFVTPTENKKLAYAVIIVSFLFIGQNAVIYYYRGDNFDPKTGESLVWITPSTGKRWYNKPEKFNFDPKTGERLRQATSDDFIKKVKKQKSWETVFEKEFVGVGFTGGDEPKDNDGTIHTIPFGRNGILIGDKIIVKGNNTTEVWDGGRWRKYYRAIINEAGIDDYFCVRDKIGTKFTVIIKRFM